LNVKDTLLSVVLAYKLITLAMKNYWNAFVVVASLLIFSSCSLTQPGSQQVLVADDLYDSFQKPAAAYAPKKSSHYLDPEEDATLIQEEDGVVIREDETNFLNSRSVYNSYAQGFNSGFQSGIFSANPWNNWYTNPYITFGLGGFYGSRIIAPINAWGMYDPFYNPYSFYSPYSYYDPFYGFSGLRNPYGYHGFGMGGLGYMGNYGGYNGYNGFGNNFYYAPSVGNVNREPAMRPVRGPREDRSNNQYGSGNMNNTPRGGNNSYNTQSNNQPRIYNNPGNSAPVQAAPRRNTNFEYRSAQPQTNYGQSQQNYSAPSSNYSSGSSYSGSSSGGGSSRGPR
jgi:uncharacterized membrane protein YgcG